MTNFLVTIHQAKGKRYGIILKKAYELRSQVVHGTKPLPSEISMKGLNYSVYREQFVFKIEEYTRKAIKNT